LRAFLADAIGRHRWYVRSRVAFGARGRRPDR
jgi:hypothetical protein